jgi:hypothetical protein
VAEDLEALPELIRVRHFAIATGMTPADSVARAFSIVHEARDRVARTRPTTWGEAIADLSDQLRICLRDRHVRLIGNPPSRIRAGEPVADVDDAAPAVETGERHGVLCVRLRRLWGSAADDRLLWNWAGQSEAHFAYDRILVDLRGNTGGNDAITWDWMGPAVPAGATVPGTAIGWYVGETPLGIWNSAALVEARDGLEAVPRWHRENRHIPRPDDDLRISTESGDEAVPEGARPWHGRMLVLVDGGTRSSGESSAWLLRHAFGARVLGCRTAGMLEYGNIVPYLLPASGLHISLPTKHNDFGIPIELVGFPVDAELDPRTPLDDVARDFDGFFG